jgi:hypothetical protein
MNIVEHLRQRTWPTRPEKVNMGDYGVGTFVREGHVETRALQRHQNLSEPIPPGECAITSLCRAKGGVIYGATSGRRAHLFSYNPGPGQDSVVDLGVLPGAREVCRSLVATDDGRVIGGVTVADESAPGGYLFAYPRRTKEGEGFVDRLATPVEGEGIACLVIDNDFDRLYGLSTVTGTFFMYDLEDGTVTCRGPVDETNTFSQTLVLDNAGNVYGAKSLGELFRYEPDSEFTSPPDAGVTPLGVRIPSVAGRSYYNRLDSAVLDEGTGLIYGGGSADGVLFVFNPKTFTMTALGKAAAAPRVRCMTVGLDGRVYGVAGERDGMGRLFRYDPETRELTDLGIPYSGMDRVWHGYEFDAACTGEWGEIYLGESDRVSHLFLYFPPVRRRLPAD